LRKFLHFIFSFPFFYDQMQRLLGVDRKKALVRQHYSFVNQDAAVLDLGGGTGLYRDLWPGNYHYICLDNDPVKLKELARQYPDDEVILGDAGKIPLRDGSVDVIFCSSFSHHITLDVLDKVLAESARVLKVSGKILFIDAVFRQESPFNRFLWKIDRGSYPHTADELSRLVRKHFLVDITQRFSIHYDYIFFAASKQA